MNSSTNNDKSFATVSSTKVQENTAFPPPETVIDSKFIENLCLFLEGKITWAQVEGWTSETAYRFTVLGFDLMCAGKLEESKQVFSALHAINPKVWYFPYAWAQAERLSGDHEKAFSLLDISISLEQELGEPLLLKGICQLEKGLFEEAKKSLVKARDLGNAGFSVESSLVPLSEALLDKIHQIKSNIEVSHV